MKISPYSSTKITVLSSLMILLVVYVHSYYLEAEALPMAQLVQNIGRVLTAAAVPLFYAISGYLFFRGVGRTAECGPKMKKRVRTLVAPFVIWNIIFILWYVLLHFTPGISAYVNSDILSAIQWTHPLSTLQFLFIEPAGFHLWFLRDLILFVAISPVLYLLLRRTSWLGLLILFFATGWIQRFWLTFFALGGIIALHYSLEAVDRFFNARLVVSCLLGYLVMGFIGVLMLTEDTLWGEYLAQLAAFCGVAMIWKSYDYVYHFVVTRERICARIKVCAPLLGYSFFIYLFHEPTFNIIKKLGLKVLGIHEWSLILLYLINPLIMCGLAIIVAKAIQRYLPKTYSLLTGGR